VSHQLPAYLLVPFVLQFYEIGTTTITSILPIRKLRRMVGESLRVTWLKPHGQVSKTLSFDLCVPLFSLLALLAMHDYSNFLHVHHEK
jgi:hypothetical protein